ncbi:hypothetical protein [Embleya sp. NPDC001921]
MAGLKPGEEVSRILSRRCFADREAADRAAPAGAGWCAWIRLERRADG